MSVNNDLLTEVCELCAFSPDSAGLDGVMV